jgi:hypothetical protein
MSSSAQGSTSSSKRDHRPILQNFLRLVPVPEFHLVFLDPDAEAINRRQRERGLMVYGPGRWSIGGLQALLREQTDRIGLWLDTTGHTAEQRSRPPQMALRGVTALWIACRRRVGFEAAMPRH